MREEVARPVGLEAVDLGLVRVRVRSRGRVRVRARVRAGVRARVRAGDRARVRVRVRLRLSVAHSGTLAAAWVCTSHLLPHARALWSERG